MTTSAWATFEETRPKGREVPHGTHNGYVNYGCREECCRAAYREKCREYRNRKRADNPAPYGASEDGAYKNPYLDAAPLRELYQQRVDSLVARGYSFETAVDTIAVRVCEFSDIKHLSAMTKVKRLLDGQQTIHFAEADILCLALGFDAPMVYGEEW